MATMRWNFSKVALSSIPSESLASTALASHGSTRRDGPTEKTRQGRTVLFSRRSSGHGDPAQLAPLARTHHNCSSQASVRRVCRKQGSAHLASFPARTFRAPVSSPAEACPVLAGAAAAQEQGAVPVLYIVVVGSLACALCLALWTVCKVLSRRARGNQSDSHGNSPKSARHFCPDRPATVGRPVEGDPCPKSPRESARGPARPNSDMSRVEWEGQTWQDQRTSV
mmetsp:Transcript_178177/g.571145  ORF Transcript_178177/g.571145 Transcript_178177/m.571145 type:complete len:225 (-) Transcript_178177:52-726(-)